MREDGRTTPLRGSVPGETEADDSGLRGSIERPQIGYLWTTPHKFTPRIVDKTFGDGRRLAWLTTINNRPAFWVVRVDSGWDLGLSDPDEPGLPHDAPCMAEMVDEIIEAIEEQFGRWDPDHEYDMACADALAGGKRKPREDRFWGRSWREFPAIDTRDGCSWGTVCWPGTARSLKATTPGKPSSASEGVGLACGYCAGTGMDDRSETCDHCDGSGDEPEDRQ